jgi:hypothetical protein
MKKALVISALLCLAGASAAPAFAQDRADIDRTQIIGNRELPKVLYIVPWKKPMPGDLSGRPLVSVLDEALAPVDRDVFRRQVRYDGIAQAQGASTSTSALHGRRTGHACPARGTDPLNPFTDHPVFHRRYP